MPIPSPEHKLNLTPLEAEALRSIANSIGPNDDPAQFVRDVIAKAKEEDWSLGDLMASEVFQSLLDKLEALKSQ